MDKEAICEYYTLFQYGDSPSYFPDLPTFDPKCLAVQAFLKFCGVPFKVENTANSAISPDGKLPILCLGDKTVILESEMEKIIEIGFSFGSAIENTTDDFLKNDIFVWSCFASDALNKLHLYYWFYHEDNYQKIKNLYAPSFVWPLNILEMRKLRNQIRQKLDYEGITNDDSANAFAIRIFSTLSDKLSHKFFFCGDEPSRLDSIIFGYLSVFLNGKLPCANLQNILLQHQNLVDFCDRILTKYFQCAVEIDYITAKNWIHSITQKEKDEKEQKNSELFDTSSSMAFLALILTAITYLCTQNFTSIFDLFRNLKFSNRKLFTFNKDPFYKDSEIVFVDDDGEMYDWDEEFREDEYNANQQSNTP